MSRNLTQWEYLNIMVLWQIMQFLETQGFLDYLERCNSAEENANNLLDKLQDATGRGQNPLSIFPSEAADPEIVTIADPETECSGTCLFYVSTFLTITLSSVLQQFKLYIRIEGIYYQKHKP
jgi:hypothetical protein